MVVVFIFTNDNQFMGRYWQGLVGGVVVRVAGGVVGGLVGGFCCDLIAFDIQFLLREEIRELQFAVDIPRWTAGVILRLEAIFRHASQSSLRKRSWFPQDINSTMERLHTYLFHMRLDRNQKNISWAFVPD